MPPKRVRPYPPIPKDESKYPTPADVDSDDEMEKSDGDDSSCSDSASESGSDGEFTIEELLKIPPESREFLKLLNDKSPDSLKFFGQLDKAKKQEVLDSLRGLKTEKEPTLIRIINSASPQEIKSLLFEKYLGDQSEKQLQWINSALKLPLGLSTPPLHPANASEFLVKSQKILDDSVWGHQCAKHKLVQYLAHIVRNPMAKGLVIGLEGPMGVGKTTLISNGFAKALGRPFVSVPLSGYDLSVLLGHSYTYEGSSYGQIAANVMRAGVMNPVLYFDEIDKISKTPKGEEVMNTFIQLTDPIQSATFQDRYFAGMNIDLSNAIFVFSYNDASNVSPILLSRIFRVIADTFDTTAKVEIVHKHLIPAVSADIGIDCSGYLSKTTTSKLITTYTCEGGVRKLRDALYEIFREVNLKLLTGEKVAKPITWAKLVSEYLKVLRPITPIVTHKCDQVGKINGLYACDGGYGGILPIEVKTVPSEKITELVFTGRIGPVMTESGKVALAVAWSLIPTESQEIWKQRKLGFHVHCSELSVVKEGPSATLALTILLYSVLTNQKIRANMAITGEMDFSGNAMAIGGLKEKMTGAREAGIDHVLYPTENQKDVDFMLSRKEPIVLNEAFAYEAVADVKTAIEKMVISRKRLRSE